MEVVMVKELKKTVLAATEVPDECIKNAQVMIVADLSWHIIAPNPYRMHGLGDMIPAPKVTCPIVDVRGVPAENDDAMLRVMNSCVDKSAGVLNLAGLLTGLEALGGRVSNQLSVVSNQLSVKPSAADVSAKWRGKKEGDVEKKLAAVERYENKRRVARRVHGRKVTVS